VLKQAMWISIVGISGGLPERWPSETS